MIAHAARAGNTAGLLASTRWGRVCGAPPV